MPRLQSIWSDYDASEWWCSPMAERRTNDAASMEAARRPVGPGDLIATDPIATDPIDGVEGVL
jgi:hypothetical protein